MQTHHNPSVCANEPIHIPGRIQAHGMLIVCHAHDLTISHVSENIESVFGIPARDLLGVALAKLLPEAFLLELQSCLQTPQRVAAAPLRLRITQKQIETEFDVIVHRNTSGYLLLELERNLETRQDSIDTFYHSVRSSIDSFQNTLELEELSHFLVHELKRLTGFHRVMLYRFSEDWNGCVVAEAREPAMGSFLHHYFPASDIPEQARRLYQENLLRLIPDVGAPTSVILTAAPSALDLTHATLRAVAPIHLEYLRNMEVQASMSVSILKEDKLWGLVACHHETPRFVNYQTRSTCQFLSKLYSHQVTVLEQRNDSRLRAKLRLLRAPIFKTFEDGDLLEAVLYGTPSVRELTNSDGAALFLQGQLHTVGTVPNREDITSILAWLRLNDLPSVFHTQSLSKVYPAALSYATIASGLCALPLTKKGTGYLLLFRKEILVQRKWAGNPEKALDTESMRVSPRKSFAAWEQTVTATAKAWKQPEIDAAIDLREAILFEELLSLFSELEQTNRDLDAFANVASHDLKEPVRTVHTFLALLKIKLGDTLDAESAQYVQFAIDASDKMRALIENILDLSRAGTQELRFNSIDANAIVRRVTAALSTMIAETGASIVSENLPIVVGDPLQMAQLIQNLVANAIYYRSERPPVIRLSCESKADQWIFKVRDNGMGIESKNTQRIFKSFQRIHTRSEHKGTGLGLAICKRIVERHGGDLWLTSTFGEGTTFFFSLPRLQS